MQIKKADVQSLQSHIILTMSHWSSGLTCLLPVTRVTGSNPLGGTYVNPGFSCQHCLATLMSIAPTNVFFNCFHKGQGISSRIIAVNTIHQKYQTLRFFMICIFFLIFILRLTKLFKIMYFSHLLDYSPLQKAIWADQVRVRHILFYWETSNKQICGTSVSIGHF